MYVKEAFHLLNTTEFNQALPYNPTESLKQELGRILSEAKDMGWITEHEHRFLWNPNPRMTSFYMPPKIHKSVGDPPG